MDWRRCRSADSDIRHLAHLLVRSRLAPATCTGLARVSTIMFAVVLIISVAAGALFALFYYLHNSTAIKVVLQWEPTPVPGHDPTTMSGIIRIVNVGRKPMFISRITMKVPKDIGVRELVIAHFPTGKKLSHGDAAEEYSIKADLVEKYKSRRSEIVAAVKDTSGRVWMSTRPASEQPDISGQGTRMFSMQ
jgi:hypothetical protein